MADLPRIWTELEIPADYAVGRGLAFQPEAAELISIGADNQNRDCRLAPGAAHAWRAMRDAAETDGIALRPISGFRSVERQAEVIRNKLARGDRLDDILCSNAAPGYSEHHTGCALDITDGVAPPLSESFERTPRVRLALAPREALWFPPQLPPWRFPRFSARAVALVLAQLAAASNCHCEEPRPAGRRSNPAGSPRRARRASR